MALVSAVATLLAALFVCAGTTDAAAHRPAEPRMTLALVAEEAEEYVCPYDRGDCSLFPSLSPAVLTAPPLDPPPQAEGRLPRLDTPHHTGPAPRSDARPRAPDLHVLQVLRT
ncbi:hypothetical protein [Streptomyces sp. NPDC006551]|uniref:hypothetical protein n=1 Tax=Streptomyces sp. NPDC006551 TaxID=3157178 RepID=UPI0033BADB86